MKRYSLLHVFAALTVITLSLFTAASAAQAMGTATVGTTLTFEPPPSVSVGDFSIVVLQLISSKGEPVANQPVELFVNGEAERRSRTDAEGKVSIKVRRDEAGTYALSATFKGSKAPSLGSSKAAADLVITPALIEVHVTPPLPNIRFALDEKVFDSDDYGVARIEVAKAGKYHLELLPLETNDPDIQMAFGRWADDYFIPSREIEIPLKKQLQVGLEVSYQVSQTYIDLKEKPVDMSRITSITLKGSNGATYTFEDNLPHWLPAGRVIRLNNGLEETKILYSVISVVIDGSNVVSQAQQRFYAHQNDVWTVKLLLYSASFTAHDALFRFPIGSGIRMEYPDGDVQTFEFDRNQEYTIRGLARGIYRVTVIGAQGFAPPTPIALSRNQDVDLMVFSYLDMGVLASIGVIAALGLLFFGRPHLLRDTVMLPVRVVAKARSFRPAVLKESVQNTLARGSALIPGRKKRTALPQEDGYPAVLDPSAYTYTEVEPIGAALPDPVQDEEAEIETVLSLDSVEAINTSLQEETPVSVVEQEDAAVEPSTPEAMSVAAEPEEVPVDAIASISTETETSTDPVSETETAEVENSAAPANETDAVVKNETGYVCQVCGSSQLVKKESKRPNQQRYQCQTCGASNNFGSKRQRKHRQKNRVESLV